MHSGLRLLYFINYLNHIEAQEFIIFRMAYRYREDVYIMQRGSKAFNFNILLELQF
jgi:hypothetical protein